MRVAFKTACVLVLVMIVLIVARPGSGFAAPGSDYISMSGWDFKWAQQKDAADLRAIEAPDAGWKRLNSLKNLPTRDQDTADAWYKTVLPELKSSPSALLLKKVYGQHIIIYLDQRKVYEQTRSYMYDANKILLPLSPGDMGKTLRIQVQAEKDRIGIAGDVLTGDYQMLLKKFVKSNLDDLILGSSMVFVGLVMLIVALFMRKGQLISWLTLTLILLSIGAIILTYSPLLYSLYNGYGQIILIVFDVALLSLLPALTFYFEKTVGAGYMQIIRHFRKFQIFYSLVCLSFMVVNLLLNDRIFDLYYLLSVKILGYLIILQIILVVVSSIGYAVKGNRNALIFTSGFVVFGLTVLIEMISFIVSSGKYELYWWKWGVLGFALALIAVLGQKFTENHRQILMYSKELEMFNMELQRSEKMEIISDLAASVAHEVRNPLQVTRGFLQLLLEKSIHKDREYLTLALKELDRASGIITDFLTFAKPEIDQVQLLELADEFRHIEGILIPLANFQGSKITSRIPKDLYIEGNSSKFKQAFINIIKNSIEALREEGQVHIWAYTEQDEVVIHIQDNGEGMEPSEVSRLGEPYFSNKTKGTGLGLMVTFRIIEVMKGNMKFLSEKGVGTEVIVRFPAVIQEDPI
ncbi:sensor histidine kinase [Paenibacillus dokdonensis]|uniref:sensor histidine kinase n=1 Tax=Paenibacillus dokdonensis TaxID=2567944 RepID=UPI0010A7B962|nr:sensor histidine kinase [Paenibacillus dokdonensis]